MCSNCEKEYDKILHTTLRFVQHYAPDTHIRKTYVSHMYDLARDAMKLRPRNSQPAN